MTSAMTPFLKPPPNTPATVMAMSKLGMANKISTRFVTILSIHPPNNPALLLKTFHLNKIIQRLKEKRR